MSRFAVYTDTSAAAADFEARMSAQSSASLPVFNVTSTTYGATGNGVTDDRPAIQAALTAVVAAGGGTVYFPKGTYYLNSYFPSQTTYLLYLNGGSGTAVRVSLVFAPGAVLTTPLYYTTANVTVTTLQLGGNLEDCIIEGGDFRNTHAVTAGRTVAIGVSSSSNTVKRLTIRHNIFRNHSRTLHMQGVEGLKVLHNTFLFTNGRDSGSTNGSDPGVCLWSLCDANGQTSDVEVGHNFMDGCTSGTVAANSGLKQGQDGLVYGVSRGWNIHHNTIKRCGVEAIYPSSRQAYEATRYPCIIEANRVDGTLPTGADESVFGIRSDEHDTLATGNSLLYVQHGIYITGETRAAKLEGCMTADNHVILTGTTSDQMGVEFHTCNAPDSKGDKVDWVSTPASSGVLRGIQLSNCPRFDVANATVRAPALPSVGTSQGVYCSQTYGGRVHNVRAEYMTYALFEYQHTAVQAGNRVSRLSARNCTNEIGGATADTDQMVVTDWENPVSADNGDASVTLRGYAKPIQRFDTALTANRTVTIQNIDVSGASTGGVYEIVRTGLGAFTLTVQDSTPTTLKVIPAGTAAVVRVRMNAAGNAWKLVGYELL